MRFPDGGRRRREIRKDPVTGQQFEIFTVNVEQIGNELLKNESSSENQEFAEEFDDKFDDELEDQLENQQFSDNENFDQSNINLEIPRWTIYEALAKYLSR